MDGDNAQMGISIGGSSLLWGKLGLGEKLLVGNRALRMGQSFRTGREGLVFQVILTPKAERAGN